MNRHNHIPPAPFNPAAIVSATQPAVQEMAKHNYAVFSALMLSFFTGLCGVYASFLGNHIDTYLIRAILVLPCLPIGLVLTSRSFWGTTSEYRGPLLIVVIQFCGLVFMSRFEASNPDYAPWDFTKYYFSTVVGIHIGIWAIEAQVLKRIIPGWVKIRDLAMKAVWLAWWLDALIMAWSYAGLGEIDIFVESPLPVHLLFKDFF